jgi:hypothetical protein
MSLYTSDE